MTELIGQKSTFESTGFNPYDPDNYAWPTTNGEIIVTPDVTANPGDPESGGGVGTSNRSGEHGGEPNPNKLETIYHELGFYPASAKELTGIWELRKYFDRPGGPAKYLAVVTQHQANQPNLNSQPEAAARSIVRSWGDWRAEARADATMLDLLQEQLALAPKATTGEVLEQLRYANDAQRALEVMERIYRLNALAQTEGELPAKPYKNLDKMQGLEALDRDELRELLWQSQQSSQKRIEFWRNMQLLARANMAVKAMIDSMLTPEELKRLA